jgi:hypothetical protein
MFGSVAAVGHAGAAPRTQNDPAGPGSDGVAGVSRAAMRVAVRCQAVATFQPSSPVPEKIQRRTVSLTRGRMVASRP